MLNTYDPKSPILGLTPESSNEAIQRKAFDFILACGSMFFATLNYEGLPNIRGLEVHSLDEEGNLYIGLSKGKPSYDEIKKQGYVAAGIYKSLPPDSGGYSMTLRLNSQLEEVKTEELMAKYWAKNPGTKQMYRKDLDNFTLFKLTQGNGEFFHVRKDEKIFRLRFSFGHGEIPPYRYFIGPDCIQCGLCAEACLMNTISPGEDRYVINHYNCLECGKCHEICPVQAISKRA